MCVYSEIRPAITSQPWPARNIGHAPTRQSTLLNLHFDRFWLRHGAFWQMNLQHAVMKLSHDLRRVRVFGHGERALERPEEALEPMEFSLLFFLLGLALAGNVKDAVFES